MNMYDMSQSACKNKPTLEHPSASPAYTYSTYWRMYIPSTLFHTMSNHMTEVVCITFNLRQTEYMNTFAYKQLATYQSLYV
jgi:hypothetical protein